MELVSKKEEDDHCSFTVDEIALLNPIATRIAGIFGYLSPTHQVDVLDLVLRAVFVEHRIDDLFNPVEFLLRQGIEQQEQIADDGRGIEQAA